MLARTLEPEVMDTEREASEYDAMDHSGVNDLFVSDFLAVCPPDALDDGGQILDLGTGTALIPIEFCRQSPSGQQSCRTASSTISPSRWTAFARWSVC
jgi:hypothetical protein